MAEMSCTVMASGKLDACRIVSESPPGMGFGAAALKLRSVFRMSVTTEGGRPVGGAIVNIPIRFMPAR